MWVVLIQTWQLNESKAHIELRTSIRLEIILLTIELRCMLIQQRKQSLHQVLDLCTLPAEVSYFEVILQD
jgi:hypothetical protein